MALLVINNVTWCGKLSDYFFRDFHSTVATLDAVLLRVVHLGHPLKLINANPFTLLATHDLTLG